MAVVVVRVAMMRGMPAAAIAAALHMAAVAAALRAMLLVLAMAVDVGMVVAMAVAMAMTVAVVVPIVAMAAVHIKQHPLHAQDQEVPQQYKQQVQWWVACGNTWQVSLRLLAVG